MSPLLQYFADELRIARESAGMTQEQLATCAYVSKSTIAMVETCQRPPKKDLTTALDSTFDTEGRFERMREALLKAEVAPEWFLPWRDREREATALRSYHSGLVEGLLQAPDYIRAVLRADASLTDDDVDQRVAARLERQSILAVENPPMLIAVVDEATLRRPVGGPQVMHAQCRYLLEASQRPRTLIQVIPLSAGMHPGLDGPFVIASFDGAGEAVYLDGQRGFIVDRPEVISAVKASWETLRAEALSQRQSADLIAEVAESWISNDS
ncbi:helix-turn-helix transcriptional regulator [Haloechinothrix sp. YIM 98757]|uniref:Helix-turn-helix transcriptional regulator n=1 Tax=Haloechinothrix aidingensis TaxID=2752311 RepID=A0A838AEN8_9PSEU|nr:helix-turn-helix transcriptional regulator [Haloechinothrix aidingensis]